VARRPFALAAAFAFIAAATLIPAPADAWQRDFWCIRCGGSLDPVELALNVLLFLPLGLALRAAGIRARVALTIVAGTTVGIEILQYTLIVGRDGTLRDCITNALGGVAGFALQPHAGVLWRADRTPARRVAWAGAFAWIAHAAMASILFRPSSTPHQYFSQVAPHLGQFDVFGGTVLSASVDGVRVESDTFTRDLEARVRTADSIALAGVVLPGPPVARVAPIVNVVDGMANEIVILAQQRTALEFQARVRGQDFGFHAPAVVIDDVFVASATPAPAPMLLAGVRREYTLRLRATNAKSETREAWLTLSPSLGWALWWPFDYPGRAALVWMTAAWIFIPLALVGFWSGGLGAPLVAAIGAQVLVPMALGPGSVAWPDIVVAAMGVLAGLAGGRLRSAAGNETLGASG
jgi:hypothetical protein